VLGPAWFGLAGPTAGPNASARLAVPPICSGLFDRSDQGDARHMPRPSRCSARANRPTTNTPFSKTGSRSKISRPKPTDLSLPLQPSIGSYRLKQGLEKKRCPYKGRADASDCGGPSVAAGNRRRGPGQDKTERGHVSSNFRKAAQLLDQDFTELGTRNTEQAFGLVTDVFTKLVLRC
jgi:hypothetical protein